VMIPAGVSLEMWAASLVVDFPTDNIPVLKGSGNWKQWASFLIQENSFANNGAPGPSLFKDWQSWAQAVFKAMASFS